MDLGTRLYDERNENTDRPQSQGTNLFFDLLPFEERKIKGECCSARTAQVRLRKLGVSELPTGRGSASIPTRGFRNWARAARQKWDRAGPLSPQLAPISAPADTLEGGEFCSTMGKDGLGWGCFTGFRVD